MDSKVVVLIVDDDHAVLETMRILLDVKGGFDVHCAVVSHGAAHFLSSLDIIDVVIADVVLAGEITGIEICDEARRKHPGVGLVVISADPSSNESGMPPRSIFLRKPFGGIELMHGIERVQAFAALGLSDALPQT